jgi:hypothetical protein
MDEKLDLDIFEKLIETNFEYSTLQKTLDTHCINTHSNSSFIKSIFIVL